MSNIPAELKYTAEHEWVSVVNENTIRFGITDFAQAALGDIVFVTLPSVGKTLAAGEACGEVESTKSVSDVYAPVSGAVVAANSVIETNPETINQDPYGAGWIADVTVENAAEVAAALLSADEYRAITSA
jgi:glycine cleavage system H protein